MVCASKLNEWIINDWLSFGDESDVLDFCVSAVSERATLGHLYLLACAAYNFPFFYMHACPPNAKCIVIFVKVGSKVTASDILPTIYFTLHTVSPAFPFIKD